MTPIETLPIYFRTNDARVNKFLERNRLHHELHQKQGNGNVRYTLKILAGLIGFALFWAVVL